MKLMPLLDLILMEVKMKLTEREVQELQANIKAKKDKRETKEIGVKLVTTNSIKEKTGLISITPWVELILKLGEREV